QNLSGGQKQRVAIAGIIAMQPEYIVLDEPTAMLDPKGREEVLDTILKLNRENGITVILITHFMNEAALADRIVVMDKGTVKMEGTPKEIFLRKDELIPLGLSVPQSAMLIYALKERGLDIKSSAVTVEECVEDILAFFKERRALND
ncbi:MAG: ATP-binding cassette domain-containing protein, partial [Clostridia bacterium]|nr:ATP-binding cassette domain-containing protein [Clostridia bacterium]